MKIMVAIPSRDQCDTYFTQSLVNMVRPAETRFEFEIGTLVYPARNKLCAKALQMEPDYILWIDSDMVFDELLLMRLLMDMKPGVDLIAPVCYMRKPPYAPVLYKALERPTETRPKVVQLYDEGYPEDGPFEIAGCGFGCVLMRTGMITPIAEKNGGHVFDPEPQFGEDLTFCLRARDCGFNLWADPKIQLGHRGYFISDRGVWEAYRTMNAGHETR